MDDLDTVIPCSKCNYDFDDEGNIVHETVCQYLTGKEKGDEEDQIRDNL